MNETLYNTTATKLNLIPATNSAFFMSEIIYCVVFVIYITLGLIGNSLNILLFTSPALFRISSSLYLLSASITDLLVTVFVLPIRLSADAFNQDITSYSLLSCRFVSYLYSVCLALSPLFIVCACADRWAASCVQVNRRRFASTHTAKRMIPVIIIVCCVLYSYILGTFTVDPRPPPPYCSVDEKYAVFGLSFQLIVYSIIPPFLMALFSIGIIRNAMRKRDRVVPAAQGMTLSATSAIVRRARRRFSQMQVMLVCQSLAECVFTLPFSMTNLLSIFKNNDVYFLEVYSFVRLFIFINSILSFYIYIFSSKLYRSELRKIVQRIYHRH